MINGFKQVLANSLLLKPKPFTSELAMEGFIADNPMLLQLDENDSTDDNNGIEIVDTEVSIPNTNGRIDILARYDVSSTMAIVELKNVPLKKEHLDQLLEYLRNKDSMPELRDSQEEKKLSQDQKDNWIGILIGTAFDDENLKKALDDVNDFPIYVLKINRYCSKDGSLYVFTELVWGPKKSSRNFNKYLYRGHVYGKSRLVEAVITDYIHEHPDITVDELKKVFPDNLQGSWGCFQPHDEAIKRQNGGRKRYRTDTPVDVNGDSIVICDQWSIHNIGNFIAKAKTLGIDIKQYK